MTGTEALVRLNVFANGLRDGGFEKQEAWVRDFRIELQQLLRDEEVIDVR